MEQRNQEKAPNPPSVTVCYSLLLGAAQIGEILASSDPVDDEYFPFLDREEVRQ